MPTPFSHSDGVVIRTSSKDAAVTFVGFPSIAFGVGGVSNSEGGMNGASSYIEASITDANEKVTTYFWEFDIKGGNNGFPGDNPFLRVIDSSFFLCLWRFRNMLRMSLR